MLSVGMWEYAHSHVPVLFALWCGGILLFGLFQCKMFPYFTVPVNCLYRGVINIYKCKEDFNRC
jgi:hypothetical protein